MVETNVKLGGRPPEDAQLSMAKAYKVKQTYGLRVEKDEKILKAREVELRWRRITMNDLETIPFALFVFGGGILAGSNQTVHTGAMIAYTVIRYAHTYSYAKALQPARFWCWGGSVACVFVGIGNAVAAIL
ncbi:hypothetical protein PybrP1_003037 [[Pythium] brassicae (nom. inval.)]|nr:hypothetical protein PybrP1_003037 [[Pythium] brassicae (nom. inval.)]